MRILLTILFIVSFLISEGQPRPTGFPSQKTTTWHEFGYVMGDSAVIIAKRDTNWLPRFNGTSVWRPQDRRVYVYDSLELRWKRLLFNGDVTATQWGSITGTVTDQTDLVSYLNGNFFKQGGNSFSDTARLGTLNNLPLVILRNGQKIFSFTGAADPSRPPAFTSGGLDCQNCGISLSGVAPSTGNFHMNETLTFAYGGSATGIGMRRMRLGVSGAPMAYSSGIAIGVEIPINFAPTSGDADFSLLKLSSKISQFGNGTANGITRGLYVRIDSDSAIDFRAIQTDSGTVMLNTVTGSTTVGLPTNNPLAKFHVVGTGLFTDTLTATTMGNGDSSNRVASTAWVKRQGYGTGGGGGGGNISGSLVAGRVTLSTGTNTIGDDAGFTYEDLTNKLISDTALVIKTRQNRAQFANTVNISFDSIFAVGHSIMQGSNAVPLKDSSFAARTGYYLNSTVKNRGVSGTGSATAAFYHLGYINRYHSAMTITMIALNDTRRANILLAANRKTINKIVNAEKSMWVNSVAAEYVAGGGTGVTRYGTWTTGQNMRTDAGKSTNGAFTTALNDSLTYTATGTDFYVMLGGRDGSAGTYIGTSVDIYVDNVLNQTVNTNLQSDGIPDSGPTDSKGIPYSVVIRGLSNGPHTIKVVKADASGYLYVDVVGTLLPPSQAKPLMFFHEPYMNSTGYATVPNNSSQAALDTINVKYDSLFASSTFTGYSIFRVPTNNTYNTSTGLDVDGIHPNNLGHYQIFSGDSALFNMPTLQPIENLAMTGGINGFYANIDGRNERLVQRSYVDSTFSRAFQQNGNSFGTTAVLGTQDNQPISFIVNNVQAGRIFPQYGNWTIGNINTDPGFGNKLQVDGSIVLSDANNRGLSIAGEFLIRKGTTTTRYLFGAGPASAISATHVYGIGPNALSNINSSANDVYVFGQSGLISATSPSFGVAIGGFVGQNITTSSGFTLVGRGAGGAITNANWFTAVGYGAGSGANGSNNIFINASNQIGSIPSTTRRAIALTIGAGFTDNQSKIRSNMFFAGGGSITDSLDVVFDPSDVSNDSTSNVKVRAYISGGFGNGTNSRARDLHLSSGLSTGNATNAGISFWTSLPGSSGTTLQGRQLIARFAGDGQLSLNKTLTGTNTMRVLVKGTDSVVYQVDASSFGGGTLSNTQIGVGNGSNQLSGSTAFIYDGTTFKQENALAAYSSVSTTALGLTSGGDVRLFAKLTPTAGGQRLGGIMAGTLDGGTTENITAGIQFWANAAQTPGSSEQTYITFSTTAAATVTEVMRITHNFRVAIGLTSPTARLHLPAGTAVAQNALMKWNLGADLPTAETGAWEYATLSGVDRIAFTPTGTTRKRIPLMNDVTPTTGGILQGNGTDFTLLALGTANQQLRVNAGGTALEYFTPSAGGNTIYTGDGTLGGNRAIAGGGNTLSFNNMGITRLNAAKFIFSTAAQDYQYSSFVSSSGGREFWFGYDPNAGFSKGQAYKIDTNNNTNIGAGVFPTTHPMYTNGNTGSAINGFTIAGGYYEGYQILTATGPISAGWVNVYVDASAGNVTATLPAVSSVSSLGVASGYGWVINIKRIDATANTVTIQVAGASGDLIDGASSFTLATNASRRIQAVTANTFYIQ